MGARVIVTNDVLADNIKHSNVYSKIYQQHKIKRKKYYTLNHREYSLLYQNEYQTAAFCLYSDVNMMSLCYL